MLCQWNYDMLKEFHYQWNSIRAMGLKEFSYI